MKKTSARTAAGRFKGDIREVRSFVASMVDLGLSDKHESWIHEQAIIRLYRAFEGAVLDCLIAAINNDTEQLSETTDVRFPKHLNVAVCNYIIVRDGYFNFRGREGLVQEVRKLLRDDHYLVVIIKDAAYKDALERLFALRNLAAHDSAKSKSKALRVLHRQRMGSAGAWLKTQGRLREIAVDLEKLADDVIDQAPL